MTHRVRAALAGAATLLALAAPAAQASPDQLSIIMDDDLLVYRDDATRDAAMRQAKALGADAVRVTVLWSVVADGARKTQARDRRFRRLGADDPRAYPRLNWDRYDRLVRACGTLGLQCYLDVTPPGPSWGHKTAPRSQRKSRATWMPKASAFGQFVTAVGKRYSGRFKDENDGRRALPRVSFWALGNEPNQGGWLTPQWYKGKPYAPHLYRQLYLYGRRALQKTGHGNDLILLGELAPLGSSKKTTRSPMRPKQFIRELFCVGADDQPLRGGAARSLSKYGPLQASAFAHHPYTKNVAPTQRDPHPDAVTMANIGELPALLDDISAKSARIAPGLPILSTEFGFETNPPDPFSGVPLDTQAQWNAQGDYLAYNEPRLIGQTQFLLRDVPPVKRHKKNSKAYWFTYQSGLFSAGGTPKPAATAFALPFLVLAQAPGVANVWGQLKFAPNGAATGAQVQWRPADGSADWANVGAPLPADVRGFFGGDVPVPGPGQLRAVWPDRPDVPSLGQPVG
ncbi:MAG: hypothetical protein HZB46_06130 [Solirubrobacterales bacterium]|nr:hypothetical protein [Solirubrobacterales bacterium]